MNRTTDCKSARHRGRLPSVAIGSAVLMAFLFATTSALSAPVMEEEAVAVADLWYAMELNSPHLRIAPEQKSDRLAALQERRVYYLVSKDELVDTDPGQKRVLAYAVEYGPKGFVVVSGDDELDAVVVFSVESGFRWDHPERNFFRHFLGTTMTESFNCIEAAAQEGIQPEVHPNWEIIRAKMAGGEALEEAVYDEAPGSILVEWETALWNQCWPYNTTVNTVHGLSTDCIPTGCVATALAIKLRFHEWPLTGTGTYAYNDTWGSVRHNNHNVNYGNQTYIWSNMPTGNLTTANANVANLMYHCGVGVDMNYEHGCPACAGLGSETSTLNAATAINSFFRYIETEGRTSDHFDHMKRSIRAGLPVQCGCHGHSVVADGYRDTESPYFHINCGWGGTCNGWYNLTNVPNSSTCTGTAIGCSCPYGQPTHYIYVDRDYNGADEHGTVKEPYDTFAEGYSNCPDKGHLWLKGPKTYIANPTLLSKRMTIHSYEGNATVQQ